MAYETPGAKNAVLDSLLRAKNIAEDSNRLDDEKLREIGETCKKGFESDLASRAEWEDKYDEWLEMAMQVRTVKNYPWPKASNVKFPLLSIAAMQFGARAYPNLVPANGQIVNYRVIGADADGAKAARAQRISRHMSWQILEDMQDWEEDMDRLLLQLPIVGTAFKKTFYDSKFRRNCSHLVHAKDLVVNYWTESLEKCERKSQIYYYSKRQLMEKIQAGEFLDIELPKSVLDGRLKEDKLSGLKASDDEDDTLPYQVIEQHTFIDLDGDEYPEPYIVTFLLQSGDILRISARWDSDGVKTDEDGNIICIEPVEYFTKYSFIPNPDGGFYDIGFGLLLGPLNESVNTIINQLIDGGHMATLGAGFVSKGLRIKQGTHTFQPNEWKQVDSTVDDLKKGIFPLPVKEPSTVLFQLLNVLISSTKELASVAEIMTGKMPGQNTPAYTTKETVEQGMKVFTAIYKRCYRALASELRKLYRLNQIYLDPQEFVAVTDDQAAAQDYEGSQDDIIPAADPTASSSQDKMQKAGALVQMIQLGLDRTKVLGRVMEAMEVPNWQELISTEPPPPPPELQKIQAEVQMMREEHQLEMKKIQMELQALQQELQMKLEHEKAKIGLAREKLGVDREKMQIEAQGTLQQAQVEQQTGQMEMQQSAQQHQQEMQMQEEQHKQGLEQGDAQHKQKMQQTKEAAAVKPKAGVKKDAGRK